MDVRSTLIGPAGAGARSFEQALARAETAMLAGDGPGGPGPALVYFTTWSPDVLAAVRDLGVAAPGRVLVVAARDTSLTGDLTWALVRAGASDVISGDGSDGLARAVCSRLERWRDIDEIVASVMAKGDLVGSGARWTGLLRQVVEVARFTQVSVLLTGESGTGKELVARLIHELDTRPRKRGLVVLDCATVVPGLSGSEFFGHEKGAFTGAAGPRDGAFALADGGTLFLDEVGELPLNLQAELLRVIQEGTYKRVGSNTWHTTGFRLISATNRDLAADQKSGRFRLDLYYRLAAWQFRLPPLRERSEDIEPLANSFLARSLADSAGMTSGNRAAGPVPRFDPAVRDLLVGRDYPGNVRDLRQLVERIAQRHTGPGPVSVGDVPEEDRPVVTGPAEPVTQAAWHAGAFEGAIRHALSQGADLKEITRAAGETAIAVAVAASDGNLPRAAQSLGVTPRALQLRRASGRLTPAQTVA